jgi:uncharacterized protein YjiS (DUF1127 family)
MHFTHIGVLALWIVAVQHLPHIQLKQTGQRPTRYKIELGQINTDSAFTQTIFAPKDRNIKMAYASTQSHIGQSSLTERFAKVISNIITNVSQRIVEARYMQELNSLSDRDLADIGINRADIPAIAKDAAQG